MQRQESRGAPSYWLCFAPESERRFPVRSVLVLHVPSVLPAPTTSDLPRMEEGELPRTCSYDVITAPGVEDAFCSCPFCH